MTELVSPDHRTLTPDQRMEAETLLKTPSWRTERLLHLPARDVSFVNVERDLVEPAEAVQIRLENWLAKLGERQSALIQVNPKTRYVISDDIEGETATNQKALFEVTESRFKRIMWAGTTVTLSQREAQNEEGKVVIPVYPISYSEWIACQDPRYSEVFRKNGLPIPYAGIGVSVLMETTDGFIPLTRRGIETPVYPGRLYSPGGGPKPGENITEAMLQEILEETGLKPGDHFDPAEIMTLALVLDTHFDGSDHSRPEVIAFVPLRIDYRTVEKNQYEVSTLKDKKQEDVWGIVPVTTFEPNLVRQIIYDGFQMCPPTEAGLSHALFFKALKERGQEYAFNVTRQMIDRMKSFRREPFMPSLSRLSNID